MVRKIANNVNPMNVVKQIIHILNDASAKKNINILFIYVKIEKKCFFLKKLF